MAGLADLYNLTLAYCGINEEITNPDSPANTAKTLRRFWPMAREMTLRDFPWACARKTRAAALRAQPVPGWSYTYDYPDDAVFVLAVMPETGLRSKSIWRDCWDNYTALRPQRFPFDRYARISPPGQVIVTDLEEAYLLYICKLENPALFDIGLFSAAAAKLGTLVTAPLQVKPEFVKVCNDTYEIERAKAAANDLNEGYPDAEPETPSIACR